jgi:hypothetical protein
VGTIFTQYTEGLRLDCTRRNTSDVDRSHGANLMIIALIPRQHDEACALDSPSSFRLASGTVGLPRRTPCISSYLALN